MKKAILKMKKKNPEKHQYSTELRKKDRSHCNGETSIKPLYRGGGSKEKIQKSTRGIFITNTVPKAFEIVKKIQNKTVQRNMSNMQAAGKKNRSTMDGIIVIKETIEKQRQSHKKKHIYYLLMQKNTLTNYG